MRGLWAVPNPEPLAVFRPRMRERQQEGRGMAQEIGCPFCRVRIPNDDPNDPFDFREDGEFRFHQCGSCPAVASPSCFQEWGWDILPDDAVRQFLCTMVTARSLHECEFVQASVTGTDPPLRLLWVRRRTG